MVSHGVLLYFSKEMLDKEVSIQEKMRSPVTESGDSNEDQVSFLSTTLGTRIGIGLIG